MNINARALLFFVVFLCFSVPLFAQKILWLKEQQTRIPISGAVVQYKDSYKVSDREGKVILPDFKGRLTIKISHIGFVPLQKEIELNSNESTTIFLQEDRVDLEEVTIVGSRKRISNNVEAVINKKSLESTTGQALGDVLSTIEGVSSIKSGATVVKPVIQGLHSNRIVLLNNNVVHQGQDWGADHAPEIDPFMAKSITIVKGAEGVKYGANALGGVALISPGKLPYNGKNIQGSIGAKLATNGYGWALLSMVEGSTLHSKLAWRFQGTQYVSADTRTPEYVLNNTASKSLNVSGVVGYKSEKFGAEAFYSRFYTELGVFFGSHIGNREDLLERFNIGRPLRTYPASYAINAPKQEVVHHLVKANAFWKPFSKGKFDFQYAFQFDDRKEFSVRRLDRTKTPALFMELSTHSLSLNYKINWNEHWMSEVGSSYTYQINYNVPGTGIVPVIPNFASAGIGIFAIQKYRTPKLELEAGVRYDYDILDVKGITEYSKRYQDTKTFRNTVYNIGGVYKIANWRFTSNVGVAWRAPHVSELYSNGLHHGAAIYEKGDKNLGSERGMKWISSVSYQTNKILIQISGFLQKIQDYIYDEPTTETITTFSGEYPIFQYKQNNAFFRGADLKVKYQFHPNWEYMLKGATVYATNLDNNGYFPFIPSERIENEMKFSKLFNKGLLSDFYCSLQYSFVAKQTRFNSTTELVASTPDAYHLFNINAGFSIPVKTKTLSVYLSVDNLTDKLYKEYTNRFRYYAHETGRNIQLKTVFKF